MRASRAIASCATLAVWCLAGLATPSLAEFRHLSSRMFEGHGSETISPSVFNVPFHPLSANGRNVFLIASTSGTISFGSDFVGPDAVGARFDNSAAPAVWARRLVDSPLSFL